MEGTTDAPPDETCAPEAIRAPATARPDVRDFALDDFDSARARFRGGGSSPFVDRDVSEGLCSRARFFPRFGGDFPRVSVEAAQLSPEDCFAEVALERDASRSECSRSNRRLRIFAFCA